MKICLIIIYYNEYRYLDKLFSSLATQTVKPDKIVFVNNGAKEDPMDIVKKFNKKLDIEYIKLPENLYFTRGMNIGIRWALQTDVELFGFMNSDMWCDKNMIEEIENHFEANKDVVALTPNIRDLEDTKNVFYPIKYDGIFMSARPACYTVDCETDFMTGASMFVRTDVLEDIGLFYEPYIHGTEDFEFCDKLKAKGKLKYIFSTSIHHQSDPLKKNKVSLELEKLNSKNWYIYCLRNKKSNLILFKLAFFKNLLDMLKGDEVAKYRFWGKVEGLKETWFHLTNKDKFL